MTWNDKNYTAIVEKHPELDSKPESVALAVWALNENKDMTPDAWRKLSKDTGIEVRGRAVGSARLVLGMAPKTGKKAPRHSSKPDHKPGRPAKALRKPAAANGQVGDLEQVMASIRSVQQERDQAFAMLRKLRDEIDTLL